MKIEKVDVRDIVRQYGTPVYVYSLRVLRESIAEILPLSPIVRFSMKSCSNAAILKEMLSLGIKIDAVSVPEIQRALKAGYPPSDICLTSDVFFNVEDAEFCLKNHIFVVCGSLGMLEEYGQTRKRLKSGSDGISIRINPGEGAGHSRKTNTGGPYSKHGIWYENLKEAKALAEKYNLRIIGVHTHIGSGGDMEHLQRITGKLTEFAKQFPDLRVVNFGGGLPHEYHQDKPQVDISEYHPILEKRKQELEEHFRRPIDCEIEPGRRFVAACGYLVGEVRSLNHTFNENKKRLDYVLTNIGFCHLLRPMAYGSYHPIWFVGEDLGPETDLIVAGPVCESGDLLTQKNEEPEIRKLPMPKRGDLVVVGSAGAYGFVMSSNYNSQPLIPEVMVDGHRFHLIRRRQTLEDVIREEQG
ncbi:MAG: diaminopimelate decarboxylase [Nitrospinaceae bacterium]|nr:diaminopimelate decarboxylase [Nitrospinaceae bacterium]NIR56271.1 diaminopimelate decarboxylase [Nitrospinaceae bacterium]NIS86728.1 diaminopimelate decarboxylase [Nitrospinaceae bacterium]NIT83560.1 diaminopimelate decarboxylase [Nitrospinaceae bacterium]NIU45765.1 diaminopimelate decarboxylase [Nitrospinaceae bacterium]